MRCAYAMIPIWAACDLGWRHCCWRGFPLLAAGVAETVVGGRGRRAQLSPQLDLPKADQVKQHSGHCLDIAFDHVRQSQRFRKSKTQRGSPHT
jgi:hypothetical protein